MSADSIKGMVQMRLTFNAMFNPLDKFIKELPEDKFNVLFDKAYEKLQERAKEYSKRGFSMGKRGCDMAMVNDMEKLCLEMYYDECRALLGPLREKEITKGLKADLVILDECADLSTE